ncbi:MAG TPA: OmpA family protein [Bryobacteraceae bacterium]
MKTLLFTSGLALVMLTAGCSKKAPVAATPKAPDTTPVAAAPARTPPAARPTPAPTPARAPQTVAQATPRSAVMPAAVRATLNDRLAKMEDALFDYDKATIRTDATTALKDDVGVIRDILAAYPNQKLLIEGHADERGSEEYNLALGDRRAQSVKDFLTSMGIPAGQLTLISYGKERPVCSDETEACWQRNRRAHVTAAQ